MNSPCIQERPSGPSTRAAQYACRYLAVQRQPLPASVVSDLPSSIPVIEVCTYHGEILKRPCLLNVLERLLQVLQLLVDHRLRLFRRLHSLGLEGLNGLDLPVDIVRLGLEGVEASLNLIDNGSVLENGAVVREVDGLRLLLKDSHFAARIVIALLEGLQGCGRVSLKTELCADLGPVELEGGAAL